MNFHTFGDPANPALLLIHGVLNPWQTLEEISQHFSTRYYVIIPALDAHEEEKATDFESIAVQAEKLEDYISENLGGRIFAAAGFSMGGAIAALLWKNGIISMEKLILDGAPLTGYPSLAEKIMTNNYINIIHSSKKRDPKTIENFKKYFLPEKYLDSYLKIADNMSDSSVKNMVASIGKSDFFRNPPSQDNTEILFIHGTKGNEIISKAAARKLKKLCPKMKVHCFKGYAHCQAAIFEPQKWISVAEIFLINNQEA